MVSFLSAYGIATFIYYDANFGRTITWGLPLQIPAIIPEIWPVIIPGIVVTAISSLFAVIILTYGIDIIRGTRAVAPRTAFWPPLWWWFGLGVFALDELAARSLLHRLSASGGVVVELSRGGKAIVVSADLYGMYLCRLGEKGNVCNDIEWVRYGEVKFKVSRIIRVIKSGDRHVICRFIRKVMLPILASSFSYFMISYVDLFIFHIAFQFFYYKYIVFLTYFITKYINLLNILLTILTIFLLFVIVFLFICQKDNDLRELIEYIHGIIQDKEVLKTHLMSNIFFSIIVFVVFIFLTSDIVALSHVFFIAFAVSFLSRADPMLSRYLYPRLEVRLMCVDGLVIGLARGGCLQWAKVGVAPLGSDIEIRDEYCVVVVSPYDKNVRSGQQRYLCGPACPPVRVVVDEELQGMINTCLPHSHEKPVRDVDWRWVAVGVLDMQKYRYYYYVVDSSR
jgi:hypothetical protein